MDQSVYVKIILKKNGSSNPLNEIENTFFKCKAKNTNLKSKFLFVKIGVI